MECFKLRKGHKKIPSLLNCPDIYVGDIIEPKHMDFSPKITDIGLSQIPMGKPGLFGFQSSTTYAKGIPMGKVVAI